MMAAPRIEALKLLDDTLELISIEKFYEDKIPTERINDVYFSKKHPSLLVIDKENGGGKSDALNDGSECNNDCLLCYYRCRHLFR
jgi:hypothetical protein